MQTHLVDADEAQAQRRQHLDHRGAAVVPQRVVGLQLGQRALPGQVLPHQRSQVAHHKRTLLHLTVQQRGSQVSANTSNPEKERKKEKNPLSTKRS